MTLDNLPPTLAYLLFIALWLLPTVNSIKKARTAWTGFDYRLGAFELLAVGVTISVILKQAPAAVFPLSLVSDLPMVFNAALAAVYAERGFIRDHREAL